jgi:hypothetical protein
MVILDPYGMTFDAVGVFGLAFYLLFRSWSTYCDEAVRRDSILFEHPQVKNGRLYLQPI